MHPQNTSRAFLTLVAIGGFALRAAAAPIDLRLDFNDDDAPGGTTNTEPGFVGFTLNESGTAVNGVTIAVSAVGSPTTADDRLRTTPIESGAFTFDDIYQDFIFHNNTTSVGGAGIDISLSGAGLDPFQQYTVTIYAFDTGSVTPADGTGARAADYTANGAPLFTTSFVNRSGGADFPTSNDQYAFSGTATADEFGSLLLSGRRISGQNPNLTGAPGVFLNALIVVPVPEPSSALFATAGIAALLGVRRRRG